MGRQDNNKKIKLSKLFIIVIILFFLAGAGMATGLVAVSIKDMPAWNKKPLVPVSATRIYDKNNDLITRVGVKNRIPVNIDKVPGVVQDAFMAAEDHRFYEHHGISFKSITRAAWNDIMNQDIVEGGSTITQQLVKLAYLTPKQTFKRKIQEMLLSFKVERNFSKQEILQMYLNKIYLGEGAYGIQAAAKTYFNKDIEQINTLNEAATLAALPKAPSTYSPFQNYETAKLRRNLILNNMAEYGFASPEEVAKVKEQEIFLQKGKSKENDYPYSYFMDYVVHKLINTYGDEKVFKEGLNVYTTLNPEIQKITEAALSNADNYPYSREGENGVLQPQGAMVILDPSDGTIEALVGGREHSHKRGLNRATRPRQPGSAFKPIIAYGPAIELRGMGPASVIDDAPVNYPKYNNYAPHNYDYKYRGLITMRTALTRSVNVAAVKLLMEHVGISNAINFADKLGIDLNAVNHGPSMALGGLHKGVTPVQLAAAYAAFANQGLYNEPTAITKVETSNGQVLEKYQPAPFQVMKPTTAFLITDMLKSVVTSGTGTGANIGRPMAGKTGTTDESKDIWFSGYTPDYVGTIWIGHDSPTQMPRAYGGTYPARIWHKVMSQVHENIDEYHDFYKPSNIVRVTVDSKSGLLPGPNTPEEHMVNDYFVRKNIPTKIDNVHKLVEICPESGKKATEYCPNPITKVMLKLPYKVPDKVQDSDLRVPTKMCELHDPDNWTLMPDKEEVPESEEEKSDSQEDNNKTKPEETDSQKTEKNNDETSEE